MIYVGIDDTDTLETRGTNQLARALVRRVAGMCRAISIVRHQLLQDPRIPFTSKNGSASICFEPLYDFPLVQLTDELRSGMLADFIVGSDPGLCVTSHVPAEVTEYGQRCKVEIIDQQMARDLAAKHGIHLEGLGGTEGGVIGALAAVGLIVTGNDGRVVLMENWPDDLEGVCEVATLAARNVVVHELATERVIDAGSIHIGKRLRPNLRDRGFVVFAQPTGRPECAWEAVRIV